MTTAIAYQAGHLKFTGSQNPFEQEWSFQIKINGRIVIEIKEVKKTMEEKELQEALKMYGMLESETP